MRAVHSPITRFLTHPLVVLALFIVSFYAVYFTSLFEPLATTHVGHLVMNAHFLLVGYLYYWVIIGVDPAPRRLQPLVKLGLLLAALPFHAFFGLAMMNSNTVLGADYYGQLGLPWVSSLIADQRTGGAIAWGATELPIIIVVIALMSQWARSDEREGRRSDRQGDTRSDDELDSYNAMLAELAFRDLDAGPRPVRQGGGAEDPPLPTADPVVNSRLPVGGRARVVPLSEFHPQRAIAGWAGGGPAILVTTPGRSAPGGDGRDQRWAERP